MRKTINNHLQSSRKNSSFLLCLMITAGLARIAMVAMDDYRPPSVSHSVSQDAVTVRRSVQLVTMSIQALLARHGFAVVSELQECNFEVADGAGIVA